MKSVQYVYESKDETELVTKGNIRIENGTCYISYEDSEATGFKGSVTMIAVTGEKFASVSRTGSSNSDLVIEPGKKHHCHYTTPYGSMEVGIFAQFIENELRDKSGSLRMRYTLDINSGYISDNEIIIDVKEI